MSKKARGNVHHQIVNHKPPVATGGEMLDVTIERIVPGGLGLTHAAGRTLFVALAAPGDRLRVRIERTHKRVAFASIVEVLQPSGERTAPPCEYFGRCGGCDFQQLDYPAQLAAKRDIIGDCLRRIAGYEHPHEIHIIPSPQIWGYRARAQWQYERAPKIMGYYERASHRICDVARCPVLVDDLQETLTDLRQMLAADELPYERGDFQAIAGDNGVSLFPSRNDADTSMETLRTINGETYSFSAEGFFQINHSLLGALVEEAIKDARGRTALDLYCGVGLFTLPLARRFAQVTGIEDNWQAIALAERNLMRAGLTNARAVADEVGAWLEKNAEHLPPIDLVLLDPPRSGTERGTIESLLRLAPRRISYVACDPAILARDLRALLSADYAVESITALDLFPQTHHVETIVHLKHTRAMGEDYIAERESIAA